MSKRLARNPKSYENEARLFEEAAKMVEAIGFRNVTARKSGAVKIIDAKAVDGGRVSFWVKLGWSTAEYAAIQFGLFAGPEGSKTSDAAFVQFVRERIAHIKARGATHVLLFHHDTPPIALPLEKMGEAYAEQMRKFPALARNTKSPTMWFFDPRPAAKPELTAIVRRYAIPLELLAKRADVRADDPEVRSRMGEVELRVSQVAFRNRVGDRCRWRCVVTGSAIRATLDAAHLPGRDWRKHNNASDGILLRADIHRLIDNDLAWITDGRFHLSLAAKKEYAQYEGCTVA